MIFLIVSAFSVIPFEGGGGGGEGKHIAEWVK